MKGGDGVKRIGGSERTGGHERTGGGSMTIRHDKRNMFWVAIQG